MYMDSVFLTQRPRFHSKLVCMTSELLTKYRVLYRFHTPHLLELDPVGRLTCTSIRILTRQLRRDIAETLPRMSGSSVIHPHRRITTIRHFLSSS